MPFSSIKDIPEGSREVMGEEIESPVPQAQGQAPTADLVAARNAFHNVFFTMTSQMFDQFMGTAQAPRP
ncbi:hypothetical protein J1N35_025221 [Gossypium stocksii]|uniref:Uncharacterized protein n=1 Tax=Gossypium stocksii TaxID=47602 RepID=A0A9D3V7A5_9ROSI|nr:hypothetical protein J1N35_025221 [Gossypium stocksii]